MKDESLPITTQKQIDEILKKMTLEEKASLCTGEGLWTTKPVQRLGIPQISMADGSNGIRVMKPSEGGKKQGTASFLTVTDLTQNSPTIGNQHPATCFPSGSAIASTWNTDLVKKMGEALGEECQSMGINILLAPGINIRRSPLGGRGYEYYSEDPHLTAKIAESLIDGIQSRGVGTSVKHYAANNAETLRINMSSEVDERALREIYLAPFESVVKNSKPWTVMSAYNKVNGAQMAENKFLLSDVLRDEWGFEGAVISDWGGVKDKLAAAAAGNDLEMPENRRNDKLLAEAVRCGKMDEKIVDRAVRRILALIFKAKENERAGVQADFQGHHELARKLASESMVLLKNENDALPINKKKYKTVAVIGAFADVARYQGGGCTLVNPVKLTSPLAEIQKRAGDEIKIIYAKGYNVNNTTTDEMVSEAVEAAKQADLAIVFGGLWIAFDRENVDRRSLEIDSSHSRIIDAVAEVQKNTAVVLNNGDAVTMEPWLEKVGAVVDAFLVGEAVGEAIADTLFGIANPSGRLTVTFPKRLEDTPSYLFFPGECNKHVYGEGVFVGYRYYDKKKIDPLFPFGFGLSYTTFEYEGMEVDKKVLDDDEVLSVSVTVKNTGAVSGKEVIQIYVSDKHSRLVRPEKELKAFKKVELKPGETMTVTFQLGYRDFAFFDPEAGDWVVESGEFEICAAKNTADICRSRTVTVNATRNYHRKLFLDSQHAQVLENPRAAKMYVDFLVGKKILREDQLEKTIPLLKANYMGVYNVLTSLLGADVTQEEVQSLLDRINREGE